MNIQKIENTKYTPSFGTYFGINLQEKIMLAEKRRMLSKEQLENLNKIEDNGINAFLELADKYVVKSVNNKKGTMEVKKVLNLANEYDKIGIADVSFAYSPTAVKNRYVFHINKFLNIFNDDFNLAQKIEQAWEKLSK